MSDSSPDALADQATPDTSSTPPPKQEPKESPLLLAGGVGCILLLCFGLLAGGGILFLRSTLATPADGVATVDEVVESVDEVVESAAVAEAAEPQQAKVVSGTDDVASDDLSSASVAAGPEISPITFAEETTEDGQPIEPGFLFEAGITEIHAIFDYAELRPSYTWSQVWYHNGNELLNTAQPWPGNETGSFDYVVQAGGEPLPAGEWTLEFYIEGELLTAGGFVIEGQDEILDAPEDPGSIAVAKVYKLAYTKWNGEKHDLYIGDTNGGYERFIMSRAAGPSWSPDGRYIFFYGEEGVDQQYENGVLYPVGGASNGIARLNVAPPPASVGQVELFQGRGWNDGTARWASVSPDGKMIAYDGDRGGGRRIYFLGTEANQQFRFEIIGEQAGWSPDSQRIVYRSGRDNRTGIWISARTDSGHTRITDGGSDSFPAWSPDGKTIAFSRDAGGNVDIYTVNLDGSNLTRLTNAPGHDTLPVYLPDGDIVFRSARTGSWAIWKMSGDGSNQTIIISNAPVGPDWAFSKMDVLR